MKTRNYRSFLTVTASLVSAASLFCASPVMAEGSGSSSNWEYAAEIYLWAPKITATTPRGDSQLPFYKIIDDLQFTFMGAVGARKDKWTFVTDLVYLNINNDINGVRDLPGPGGAALDVTGEAKLKSWIVTPTVGYAIHDSEKARIEILGGVRYLDLKAELQASVNGNERFDRSMSEGYWDAIIGARANFSLNEHWYIPIHFDIGTGETDGTWQGFAGVGYKFEKFNTILAYRYLDYNFDESNKVLEDLNVKGLFLGFMFKF